MRHYQIAGTLFLLLGSVSARAQTTTDPNAPAIETASADPSATPEAAPAETAAADPEADKGKWQFYTLGYVWGASARGKTDVIGPLPPVDIDMSLGDVLKNFKFIFMGAAEARKDRLVILGDLSFVHLGGSAGIGVRDPNFLTAELDSRTAEITLLGGYRVVNEGPATLDLLAGGRMNFFKTTIQLHGPNNTAKASKSEDWLDPLIGFRARWDLGNKWGMTVYGDLGGIAFGSDLTWQGLATVDYQINHKMNVGVGWRHWKVDFDHGDFLYNVYQTGPIIALRSKL